MGKVYIPSIPRRGKRDRDGNLIFDEITQKPIFEPFIDFSPASAYGEIITDPIFDNPRGVVLQSQREAVNTVRRKVRDYDPEQDSFVAIGDPVAIALIGAVLTRDFGGFAVLRWDGKTRQYVKMRFEI